MEFADVLSRRRMHRAFLPDPVDPAAIGRIVGSARRAPSAGYSQGQSLVVVTDPSLRAGIAERFQLPFAGVAPLHIVVCASERLYHERYTQADKLKGGREVSWPVPYWYVDAGAAMMLILLAAIDEGLAACFVGNPDQEAILRELLGLPDDVVPIGVVLIGRSAQDSSAGDLTKRLAERRRPREQVVKLDRWTD